MLSSLVFERSLYLVMNVIIPLVYWNHFLHHVIVLLLEVKVHRDRLVEVLMVQFCTLCSQTEKCVIQVHLGCSKSGFCLFLLDCCLWSYLDASDHLSIDHPHVYIDLSHIFNLHGSTNFTLLVL